MESGRGLTASQAGPRAAADVRHRRSSCPRSPAADREVRGKLLVGAPPRSSPARCCCWCIPAAHLAAGRRRPGRRRPAGPQQPREPERPLPPGRPGPDGLLGRAVAHLHVPRRHDRLGRQRRLLRHGADTAGLHHLAVFMVRRGRVPAVTLWTARWAGSAAPPPRRLRGASEPAEPAEPAEPVRPPASTPRPRNRTPARELRRLATARANGDPPARPGTYSARRRNGRPGTRRVGRVPPLPQPTSTDVPSCLTPASDDIDFTNCPQRRPCRLVQPDRLEPAVR